MHIYPERLKLDMQAILAIKEGVRYYLGENTPKPEAAEKWTVRKGEQNEVDFTAPALSSSCHWVALGVTQLRSVQIYDGAFNTPNMLCPHPRLQEIEQLCSTKRLRTSSLGIASLCSHHQQVLQKIMTYYSIELGTVANLNPLNNFQDFEIQKTLSPYSLLLKHYHPKPSTTN